MKLFVAIPSIDGKITCDTFASLMRFARDPAMTFESQIMQWNQDVVRTRNRAVYEFLRSDCTHLWFVDADVGFSPSIVSALTNAGQPFVCATYPKKRIDWSKRRGGAPGIEWAHVVEPGLPEHLGGRPFMRARLVPMGCALLAREMLEKCSAPPPAPYGVVRYGDTYSGETHQVPALFNHEMMPIQGGIAMLPEDYSFTEHARRHGFEPWVLADEFCTHTGSMRFDVREIVGP